MRNFLQARDSTQLALGLEENSLSGVRCQELFDSETNRPWALLLTFVPSLIAAPVIPSYSIYSHNFSATRKNALTRPTCSKSKDFRGFHARQRRGELFRSSRGNDRGSRAGRLIRER